eukprot:8057803-Prorocentrum_lima.AAC.1
MEVSETHEQEDMLQEQFLKAFDQELSDAVIPTHTPPGERAQRASNVGDAGVSTPTRRTPPSPRERT